MGEEPEEERVMLTKLYKYHRGQEESWECMGFWFGARYRTTRLIIPSCIYQIKYSEEET